MGGTRKVREQEDPSGFGAEQRAMLDLLPDLACLCYRDHILHINPAGRALLGGGEGEAWYGRPLLSLLHHDYQPILEDGLAALADEPGPLPMMLATLHKDQREVEALVRRVPGGDGDAFLFHARDLTDHLRAVRDVVASENRHRSLVNKALNFLCLVTDEAITMVNRAGLDLLQYGEEKALVGQPLATVVHGDYREVLDLGLATLAEEDGQIPLKFLTRSGEAVDVEARVRAMGEQAAGSFMIEARDIRRELRSAEAVREREARLSGILNTVAEGIISADAQGVIQSFNRAAERIFGYRAQEVIGQNLTVLMEGHYAENHDAYLKRYIDHGTSDVLGRSRELSGRRKDGSVFPLELNISELRQGRTRLFTGIIRDITDRKRAEEVERRYKEDLEQTVRERTRDLSRLTRQFQGILESAGDGIVGVGMNGLITFANPAAATALGWETSATLSGRPASEVFLHGTPSRLGRPLPVRAAVRRQSYFDRMEVPLMRRDGSTFAAEFTASPITGEGETVGVVVIFRDITLRKAAEDRLRVAAAVFETTMDGITVCDPDGVVTMTNAAFQMITGWSYEQTVGGTLPTLLFGTAPALWAEMRATLAEEGHWEHELWSQRRDGSVFAARLAASSVTGDGEDAGGDGAADEKTRHIVVLVNDITQRKRQEEHIRYQASYDMLTGLPNRALFLERLNQSAAAPRGLGQSLALMFIDLDGFKAVNDTLGHEAGDILLKGAGERLCRCVGEGDTVARLGGDEFTILLNRVTSAHEAAAIAAQVIAALEVPFQLDLTRDGGETLVQRTGHVSASIGIALLPDHGTTAEDVLRMADTAMYHAKSLGKANFQFFTPDLQDA